MTTTATPAVTLPRAWADPIDRWHDHLERSNRTGATIDTYVKHVRQAAAGALADESPWEVTASTIAGWMDGHSWSRTTRAKVLHSLRTFYAWALDEGHVWRNPTAGLSTRGRPGPAPATPRHELWTDAIRDYLATMEAGGRQPGTVRIRRWQLVALSDLCADPWAVTTADLTAWLAEPEVSPEYRRARRTTAQTFYRWAVKAGHTSTDPAADLQPVILHRALPRPIDRDALHAGLRAADDRQRLILYLAALAGLRRAEIAVLHFREVLDGQQLLVHGKGGHERLVPLHPDLAAELTRERNRRRNGSHGTGWAGPYLHPDGYVFPSQLRPEPLTAKHVGKIATDCLPAGWTLHTLRHRFATAAYAAQRDLRAVQELLGHAKPETTARYAAVPDGAKLAAIAGVGLTI